MDKKYTMEHNRKYYVTLWSKTTPARRVTGRLLLLFGNRFVLKWRYSFTDSHLNCFRCYVQHTFYQSVLVARDNDSQFFLFFYFFLPQLGYFQGWKEILSISVMLQKNGFAKQHLERKVELKASCPGTSWESQWPEHTQSTCNTWSYNMLVQTL